MALRDIHCWQWQWHVKIQNNKRKASPKSWTILINKIEHGIDRRAQWLTQIQFHHSKNQHLPTRQQAKYAFGNHWNKSWLLSEHFNGPRKQLHVSFSCCWIRTVHHNIRFLCIHFHLDSSLNAPPSFRPPKKYSDISGLIAPYTDPQSKLHYHNAEEFVTARNLPSDLTAGYLALRGASSIVG